jgi:RNA polymerase sigma-70 factor (ECF subfamily)
VEPSDEALCRRVAERDEAAFDQLVARYQERAWRLAWTLLHDAEEARDVSQDAFVRLYLAAGRFDGRSRFSTWFYRVVVNLCLDRQRRLRGWRGWLRRDQGPDDADDGLVDRQPAAAVAPEEHLDRERAVKRLWEAVDRLSPRQRATVLLYAQEELPTAEIAAVLGCAEATVRVHLHRALAALRRMLGEG